MSKLTPDVVDELNQSPGGKVVSIYLPTHRYPAPPYMSEDQTRFKNLVQEAHSLLEADEGHDAQLRHQLDELIKKVDDVEFWQSTLESLAIFVAPDSTRMYRLPIECEEHVSYGEDYVTAPLIMAQSYNQQFYALALSLHDSKFYAGDMYGMEELDIGLPTSVEDALNIDEMFANSQTSRAHQGGGVAGGNSTASPHGEGDSNEAGTQERLQYFKIIEDKIKSHRDFDPKRPIVVAGTDSESGDFCANTKLSNITPTVLRGNYSHINHGELHSLVWPIVYEDIVKQQELDALTRISELQGSGKASTKLDEIETAANDGRVETLVVPLIDQTHDSVTDRDEAAPVIRLSGEQNGRLTRLAELVRRFGGQVFGVDSESMPENAPVAAIYRYEV